MCQSLPKIICCPSCSRIRKHGIWINVNEELGTELENNIGDWEFIDMMCPSCLEDTDMYNSLYDQEAKMQCDRCANNHRNKCIVLCKPANETKDCPCYIALKPKVDDNFHFRPYRLKLR